MCELKCSLKEILFRLSNAWRTATEAEALAAVNTEGCSISRCLTRLVHIGLLVVSVERERER